MKFLKDISNKQGMYRIAFTVCILVMSLVVISLTENSNQIENKEVSGDNNQAVANHKARLFLDFYTNQIGRNG